MQFPRPEDKARLARYEQARTLFNGDLANSEAARRIVDKLTVSREFTRWQGYHAEGVVWISYNLPRLIVRKFADLQVLDTPILLIEDDTASEQYTERISTDVPDLWWRMHYAKQIHRSFGDVILTTSRGPDNGPIDLRVVDPAKWFPVLSDNDPLDVEAHQIAWTEDFDAGKSSVTMLRVDVCYPDRIERRAFKLSGQRQEYDGTHEIEAQVDLDTYWPGLPEVDEDDLGGLMSCVHIANDQWRPGELFGRPEFYDSAGLIDDISWRLSSWSDANDRVSNAPEIIPEEWLTQTEDGTVIPPSQYERRFVGQRGRTADTDTPKYMEYPLEHETLKEQFEASVQALLYRHEMSPALLGMQFGRERESGEAKSLGMGTTEAATRRDLLQAKPHIDRLLTAAGRLMGLRDIEVGTHWRVGLPRTQAELMQELAQKRRMGLVTRRDMLQQLYPWLGPDALDAKLEELDAEREAEMSMDFQDLQARPE